MYLLFDLQLHYDIAPALAFDAMLKCTDVQLELLTATEKLLFVEKGIRGGLSQCSNRYTHSNNWNRSNEHMISGGRKFYYDKGKVVS